MAEHGAGPERNAPAAPDAARPGRLVDYHLHTRRCGHASGTPEEYVLAGLERGLAEMGFADHLPLVHMRDDTLSMPLDQLPAYVEDVLDLGRRYPEARLRLGIEADFVPTHLDRMAVLLAAHPFDYVIGSVHCIDGWGFDDPRYLDGYRDRNLYELWRRYFDLLGDAAECGLFDILAHPDLIKKFGMRPQEDPGEMYSDCVQRIAASGVGIEVSTAGLRKPVGEIYPAPEFLRLCCAAGVPVTLGSDAHSPAEVGQDFEKLPGFLFACGCREIAVYKDRVREFRAL